MASEPSAVVSIQQLPVQAQQCFQAMAAIELYRAQREVASYFELAYLKLADHADIAGEVRMTAHQARSQHLLSSGLMKKFTVSASQIVHTMIPMILDAVELQDRDIITDCFTQIIGTADTMKEEAERTRASYLQIQTNVQKHLGDLDKRNEKTVENEKARLIKIEHEKQLAKAADLKTKQLEDEKKKMDDDLNKLQAYRDKDREKVEALHQKMLDDDEDEDEEEEGNFLDTAIAPGSALGGSVNAIFGVVNAGVNIFKGIFSESKEKAKRKSMEESFKRSQKQVDSMFAKNQQMIDRISKERSLALERLAKIKELALAEVDTVNAESLREAATHLGTVDTQFTRIIQFWDSTAAILKFLRDDTKAGETYLKKIEDERYAKRFKATIARATTGWENFSRICSDYVQESDKEIHNLYKFLSKPIDNMPLEKRKERLKEIMGEIEADINNALPEQ